MTKRGMQYIENRLTPSLFDVVIDGVDNMKEEFFRRLLIILEDEKKEKWNIDSSRVQPEIIEVNKLEHKIDCATNSTGQIDEATEMGCTCGARKKNNKSNSAPDGSYTAKKKYSIGYRHITPSDYMTPLMYLPIQRMILEIETPFGKEQIKDAIIKAFDENWFDQRYLEIEDDFFAV